MSIRWLISVLLLGNSLVIPKVSYSQELSLKFEELVVADGLASVNCILKDREGFTWFGGTHGLYRYDGYRFKAFKTDIDNIHSISNNNVVSIYEDNEGYIWVGTMQGGINKYNPKTETFLNYRNTKNSIYKKNYITCITGNDDNTIWMGTYGEGLYVFDKNKDSMINYAQKEYAENTISNDYVFSIAIDEEEIWIATRVGILDRLNTKTNRFSHYTYNDKNYKSTRTGQRICLDPLNNVWIGTESDGLYKFETKTERFKHYKGGDSPNNISTNDVTDIKYSKSGEIWLTTFNGVNSVDIDTDKISVYRRDIYDPLSLTYNLSYCIFIDDNNTFWLGMNDGTVNKTVSTPFKIYQTSLSKDSNSISSNVVTSLYMGANYLWVGTGTSGLDRFDLKTDMFKNYDYDPNNNTSIPSNIVMNVFEDIEKNVWTGNFRNSIIGFKEESSDDFLEAKIATSLDQELYALSIFDMLEDAKQNIWVATYNHGLFKYNKKTFEFQHFTKTNTNGNLRSNTILSIFADSFNKIWIGTLDKGIQIYDQETRKFDPLSNLVIDGGGNIDFPVKDFYEDHLGSMWIGTEGGGLFYFDIIKNSIDNISSEKGFPADSFYGIIQDANNNYWFSTNNGLVTYNINNDKIQSYNTNDGLPTNDFESGANAKAEDGQLFFGSKKGLVSFYPEQLRNDKKTINLKLTTLKIFNEAIEVFDTIEKYRPLDSSIVYKASLKLPHFLNNFGFEFAVPEYKTPHNVEYQYKLDGIDDRWITAPAEFPFANYSNIPHGNYTFRVKAYNENNSDSDYVSEKQIVIKITPVWWQSKLAYLLYFLLSGSLAYYIYGSIRDRLRLKNELLLERYKHDKDEELHRSKINFFTSISHELRTSLTLLLSPLNQLSKVKTNNWAYSLIMTMNRNGQRLLSLINQILDFRKLESTKAQLNVQEINFKHFFKELCIPFYQYAEEKNVKFQLSISNNCETGWLDTDKLEIIMYNILSNAFKFAKDKIDVNIDLDKKDEQLVIKVKDNGLGIKEDELNKIFDSFYQAEDSTNFSIGTGIGLAITKNLIDIHYGTIVVKTEPNSYTLFKMIIPIKKSFYNDMEIVDKHPKNVLPDSIGEDEFLLEPEISGTSADSKPILMLVEDNFEIRTLIKDYFSKSFKVLTSIDGLEGKEKVYQVIPDIIISDIMMPRLNGLELCKSIKSDYRTSHIPIILLTARGSHEFKMEGFEYGADDYVTKPFYLDVLGARVKNLIRSRKVLRDKFRKETLIKPGDIAFNNVDETFVEKTMGIIEENMSNSKFSVSELASEIGMSHSVLYRKISALTGQTVTEFVRSIRLTKARQLLSNSHYNLSEISDMTGFSSPSYFSTCFKEKYGCAPSKFLRDNQS